MLAGAMGGAQALTVAASPLLTRLYAPEDFGAFGIFMAMVTLLTVAASLRYEVALPMAEEPATVANLLALSFVIVGSMTVLVAALVLVFGRPLAAALGAPVLAPYLWLLPLALGAGGCYQVLNFLAVREKDYRRIGRTRLTRAVAMVAVQLGLGVTGSGPLGLLLGGLASQTTGILSLTRSLRAEWRETVARISLPEMRAVASRYRSFPIFSCTAGLLGAATTQAPVLLITMFYGLELGGLFALAQRVIAAPLRLLAGAVAQVFLGNIAELRRDKRPIPFRAFIKVAAGLAVVGTLILGPLAVAGPAVFALVFGAEWRPSGLFVQLLAVGFLARFIVTPLAHSLVVLERQDLQLAWDASRVCLVGLAFVIADQLGWPANGAVAAYGVVMVISYGVMFMMLVRLIRKSERAHRATASASQP